MRKTLFFLGLLFLISSLLAHETEKMQSPQTLASPAERLDIRGADSIFLPMLEEKIVIIAETAYPYSLQWNDNTNNIACANIIFFLPVERNSGSFCFCYWAPELIAYEQTSGTPWQNQALFDFNHQALPAIDVFIK